MTLTRTPPPPLLPPRKLVPVAELVRLGYLQELNRQWLHPLGMALEVVTDETGTPVALGGIWDDRSDPDGLSYGPGILHTEEARQKAANVAAEREEKRQSRMNRLGFDVQPIPDPGPGRQAPPGWVLSDVTPCGVDHREPSGTETDFLSPE